MDNYSVRLYQILGIANIRMSDGLLNGQYSGILYIYDYNQGMIIRHFTNPNGMVEFLMEKYGEHTK